MPLRAIELQACSNVVAMARPRSIDPTAKKSRTVVLGVRFSERQLATLRRIAKARGITVTELVRSSVILHHTSKAGKKKAA